MESRERRSNESTEAQAMDLLYFRANSIPCDATPPRRCDSTCFGRVAFSVYDARVF